jgi:hypothetical protein
MAQLLGGGSTQKRVEGEQALPRSQGHATIKIKMGTKQDSGEKEAVMDIATANMQLSKALAE